MIRQSVYAFLIIAALLFISCGDDEKQVESNNLQQSDTLANIPPDTVSVNEMERLMNEPGYIVLDVRTPEEHEAENIENTLNVNFESGEFAENIQMLDKDKTYLIYCKTDIRSGLAKEIMDKMKFKTIVVKGGIEEWKSQNKPLVKLPK